MRLIDVSLPTPSQNLALDEALLLSDAPGEWLRVWESSSPMVVLGRSSRQLEEVDLRACAESNTPVLRRVSGGATIVTGPGCLMYAVVLDLRQRPELRDLTSAHRFVLGELVNSLREREPSVRVAGASDLAVRRGDSLFKVSGNSLRRVRDRLLYHGTLLYGFDLGLIAKLLRVAPRQPSYRKGRDHLRFVANLNSNREALTLRLASQWNAVTARLSQPLIQTAEELATTKYDRWEWTASR